MRKPKTSHRSLVSLKLPRAPSALAAFATHVVTCLTGNALFPSPVPTLAAVTQAIHDLTTPTNAAVSRIKGTATTRDEKQTSLVALMQLLGAHVQSVADSNVENGASIIESAGLAVRKTPAHAPRVFDAQPGPTSGTVKLVA